MLTKTKTSNSIKYIRIPVDTKTQSFLDKIKSNNPLFSDVDAAKFSMGKYFSTIATNDKDKIRQILKDVNPTKNDLTEGQIFDILKQNDLM